jgi:hypothetical protein
VFVLGLLAIWLFRKDISNLLSRMKQAKFPGGTEASFSASPEDGSAKPLPTKDSPALRWHNSGTLFWLGYDLGQAITSLLQGANRDGVLNSLRQIAHHAKCLGVDQLPDTRSFLLYHEPDLEAPTIYVSGETILGRLSRMVIDIERTSEANWERKRKDQTIREIAEIREMIGKLAEANQPGFQARS